MSAIVGTHPPTPASSSSTTSMVDQPCCCDEQHLRKDNVVTMERSSSSFPADCYGSNSYHDHQRQLKPKQQKKLAIVVFLGFLATLLVVASTKISGFATNSFTNSVATKATKTTMAKRDDEDETDDDEEEDDDQVRLTTSFNRSNNNIDDKDGNDSSTTTAAPTFIMPPPSLTTATTTTGAVVSTTDTTPRLYIYGKTYEEGLANWRKSISDVIAVARKYNAYYVEPCIFDGNLRTCNMDLNATTSTTTTTTTSHINNPVRLGDIYDLDIIRKEYYPNIISHDEFELDIIKHNSKQHKQEKRIYWYTICMTEYHRAYLCEKKFGISNWNGTTFEEAIQKYNDETTTSRQRQQQQQRGGDDELIMSSSSSSSGSTTAIVIEIVKYRKRKFVTNGMKLPSTNRHVLKSLAEATYVQQHYLVKFKQDHYDYVKQHILRLLLGGGGGGGESISDDDDVPPYYTAIHWRSETKSMYDQGNNEEDQAKRKKNNIGFIDCAKAILRSRERITEKSKNTNNILPSIIISSINMDVEMMHWKGRYKQHQNDTTTMNSAATAAAAANTSMIATTDDAQEQPYEEDTPHHALQFLLDGGMLKIDTLLIDNSIQVRDSVMLSVYDLIIAELATSFATCSDCTPSHVYCNACNHNGNFNRYALQLREDDAKQNRTSHRCWPGAWSLLN